MIENTDNDNRIMTALFRNETDAENAFQELINLGYKGEDISVLMSEETKNRYSSTNASFTDATTTDATLKEQTEDVAVDAGVGTTMGAAAGGIAGTIIAATIAIATSGVGLVAAGPIIATFLGASTGAATGGLIAAFVSSGIDKATAENYEKGLSEGGTVLGVKPRTDSDAEKIEEIWQKHNGEMSYR